MATTNAMNNPALFVREHHNREVAMGTLFEMVLGTSLSRTQ
jgi:hypothetical protein